MLVSLFLFSLYSLFSSSAFSFPISLFFLLVLFLNTSTLYFIESFSLDYFMIIDEVSLFMVFMTVVVLCVSFIITFSLSSVYSVSVVLTFIFLFCFLVFSVDNVFLLYVFYESSLLPILYIIVKWGSYPERSLSALMLLLYTSVFSFPFLVSIFTYYSVGSWAGVSLDCSIQSLDDLIFFPFSSSLLVFFVFAVKLPIYGLHFWLPIAHVEAPTFGSMILAGVLLNLGGVGLYRYCDFAPLHYLEYYLLSYFIVGIFIATLVCAFQSDFKRLIAYSSVSHIMALPFLVLGYSIISVKALILVMLFHGLSSPLLFLLVGVIYSFSGTRQLVAIRGLILISPLLSFFFILAFFFTVSAPPFPSFIGEVMFIVSAYNFTYFMVVLYLLFLFFSMVYNINWLSSVIFSSSASSFRFTHDLSFSPFLIMFLLSFLAFLLLPLISFI